MTKEIYVDDMFFMPLHIYRRHLHVSPPVRKTFDSQCTAYGRKYDYFCQIKRFKLLKFENIHIT